MSDLLGPDRFECLEMRVLLGDRASRNSTGKEFPCQVDRVRRGRDSRLESRKRATGLGFRPE